MIRLKRKKKKDEGERNWWKNEEDNEIEVEEAKQ